MAFIQNRQKYLLSLRRTVSYDKINPSIIKQIANELSGSQSKKNCTMERKKQLRFSFSISLRSSILYIDLRTTEHEKSNET